MKLSKALFTLLLLPVALASNIVSAHGGGLDSNGGHNCNVGACAGTYHYHRPRRVASGEFEQDWGEVLEVLQWILAIGIWIGLIIGIRWSYRKGKDKWRRMRERPH